MSAYLICAVWFGSNSNFGQIGELPEYICKVVGGPHFPPRREVSRTHKAPRTVIDVAVAPAKIRTAVFRSAYQRPGNVMKLAEPVISEVLTFQNHPVFLCGIPNTRG